MRVSRWWYGIAAAVTVGCGLASRQLPMVPAWVGDLLWATMVFFVLSTLAPALTWRVRALVTLAISYLVEFSQLYRADWIDRIRHTGPGHLVLGQGFAWTDLVAYAAGAGLAVLADGALRDGVRRSRSGSHQPAGNSVRDR